MKDTIAEKEDIQVMDGPKIIALGSKGEEQIFICLSNSFPRRYSIFQKISFT